MWKVVNLFVALSLFAISVSACAALGVRGSGNVVSETRPVAAFTSIRLDGLGELTFTQGQQEGLTIQADDNILPLITSNVRDGQLQLGLKDGTVLQSVTKIAYTVTLRNLNSLTSTGAGTITGTNINTDKLVVQREGAGSITLQGTAREQQVTLAGAGTYNAADLSSATAVISVDGAASAKLRVSNTLDATMSGAGSVSYIGDPQVTQHISGAGTITKVAE